MKRYMIGRIGYYESYDKFDPKHGKQTPDSIFIIERLQNTEKRVHKYDAEDLAMDVSWNPNIDTCL